MAPMMPSIVADIIAALGKQATLSLPFIIKE